MQETRITEQTATGKTHVSLLLSKWEWRLLRELFPGGDEIRAELSATTQPPTLILERVSEL